MSSAPAEVTARVARLFVYPVKSCAGVEVTQSLLCETGLDLDRAWMAVDEEGEFVTQRELPRMALIRPELRHAEVVLRAPGMLALHLRTDTVESAATVRLWGAEVPAFGMGDLAAQWISDFLGRKLRLVRFDPEYRRLSNVKWTQGLQALNQFSDGFPVLVAGEASLQELNRRLAARGLAPVGIERFRPNIVLSGLEAHDEDRVGDMRIATAGGDVVLRPVKPCPRCPIPDIDPATAHSGTEVSDTLQGYRRNDIVGGAVSFGMNAIVIGGIGQMLKVGLPLTSSWRFE